MLNDNYNYVGFWQWYISFGIIHSLEMECLYNQKTQPTPWSLIDSSVLFLVEETLSPICLVKQLKCVCKIFTKFAAKFHTHTHTHTHARAHTHAHAHTSSSFIVTLSLIRWTAYACAQFSGCSSMTNAHSETGQMAFCFQNLVLCVLCNVHCQMKLRY